MTNRISLAGILWLTFALTVVVADEPSSREQVGEVLGKPVYRDQTVPPVTNATTQNENLQRIRYESHLHGLFLTPVVKAFKEEHKQEIEPTDEEIDFAHDYFVAQHRKQIAESETDLQAELKQLDEQIREINDRDQSRSLRTQKRALETRLTPPSRQVAAMMVRHWKWQKYLYDNYGGGRSLFQQFGVEAFDAYKKWIQEQEKLGRFRIADPELRKAVYNYWEAQEKSPFLTDSPETIEASLLSPPWVKKSP